MTHPRRHLVVALGLILVGVGLALPLAWPDTLPPAWEELPPPPVSGLTLVRLAFLVEGVLLVLFGLRPAPRPDTAPRDSVGLWRPPLATGEIVGRGTAVAAVAGLVAVGAFLRLYHLGSQLWLDEILTVLRFRGQSAFAILTSFQSTNNQLLNTLAVQAMARAFGEGAAVVRLPAALLAIATLPAVYRLARLGLDRHGSLLATAFVTFSYHHVFFSQNARGYTAYLLWSLLGTFFFLRATASNRRRDWLLYVLAMTLATASVLLAVFVVAGHVAVFVVALAGADDRTRVRPLLRRAAMSWALLGLLLFHLYAAVLPEAWVTIGSVYGTPAAGYGARSWAMLHELLTGLAAGFGGIGGVLAVAVAMIAAGLVALAALWRRPYYTGTLAAPLVVSVAVLVVANLRVSPRFFLWGIPFLAIVSVSGLQACAGWLAEAAGRGDPVRAGRWLSTAALGLAIGASVAALPRYYRVPKQPSRAAVVRATELAAPGDVLVAIYLAKWGFRFYGPDLGLVENRDYVVVQSRQELEDVRRANPGRTLWLVSTFERILSLEYPELERAVRSGWTPVVELPATVGDGAYTIWKPRPAP